MNRFRQCIYTLILLLTCFVASPFIYKQIWNNSKVKASKTTIKTPVAAAQPAQTTPANPNSETQPTSEGETATANAEQPSEPATAQAQFTQSGPEYFDDALFIGDSRTVGLRDYGTLKNADYFCDIGLSAYQIDKTSVNGKTVWTVLNEKKYAKIYVMLGINEVGNDIEYTVSAYRKLVDGIKEVQPDAVIYIQANLHVTAAYENNIINNERINMLNSRLEEMADNNKVFFLNANCIFDDEYGALPGDSSSDGVHFLAKYYSQWCDWLCQNTVSKGGSSAPAATAAQQPAETATYTSEPAETEAETTTENKKPQNEEFSNM